LWEFGSGFLSARSVSNTAGNNDDESCSDVIKTFGRVFKEVKITVFSNTCYEKRHPASRDFLVARQDRGRQESSASSSSTLVDERICSACRVEKRICVGKELGKKM